MPAINFSLSGLDRTFTLGVSGELAGEVPAVLDVSATAVYYVKLSDMKKVFRFQTDSFDVNDISASDIKYFVFDSSLNWPENLVINPANANMSENPLALLSADVLATKNKVKHDFVRFLALRLFNTIHGVDLFSNEEALLNDLVSKGATAHSDIKSALATVNTTAAALADNVYQGHHYATNHESGPTNFSRELMRQIANGAPQRFSTIDPSNGIQSVPLDVDDTINFKVSISGAAGQNALTSVGALDTRIYKISLVLKADNYQYSDAVIGNIVPVEAGNTTAYPYHP
jgi:hypothetical protein